MITLETLKNFPECGYIAVHTTKDMNFGPHSEPEIQPAGWEMLLFNEMFSGVPGLWIAPATARDGKCDGNMFVESGILEEIDADVTTWMVFEYYMSLCVKRAEGMRDQLRDIDSVLRDLFATAKKLQRHPGTQTYPRAALALEGIRRYETMCTSFGPKSPIS